MPYRVKKGPVTLTYALRPMYRKNNEWAGYQTISENVEEGDVVFRYGDELPEGADPQSKFLHPDYDELYEAGDPSVTSFLEEIDGEEAERILLTQGRIEKRPPHEVVAANQGNTQVAADVGLGGAGERSPSGAGGHAEAGGSPLTAPLSDYEDGNDGKPLTIDQVVERMKTMSSVEVGEVRDYEAQRPHPRQGILDYRHPDEE